MRERIEPTLSGNWDEPPPLPEPDGGKTTRGSGGRIDYGALTAIVVVFGALVLVGALAGKNQPSSRGAEVTAAPIKETIVPAPDRDSRKSFAKDMEEEYLKKYMDVSVDAVGANSTTLRMRWVLMSRPIVYNLTNDYALVKQLRFYGFKRVRLENGYDSAWDIDL